MSKRRPIGQLSKEGKEETKYETVGSVDTAHISSAQEIRQRKQRDSRNYCRIYRAVGRKKVSQPEKEEKGKFTLVGALKTNPEKKDDVFTALSALEKQKANVGSLCDLIKSGASQSAGKSGEEKKVEEVKKDEPKPEQEIKKEAESEIEGAQKVDEKLTEKKQDEQIKDTEKQVKEIVQSIKDEDIHKP